MAESNNSAVVNNKNPLKLSNSKSGQSSELQEKSKTDKVLRPILLEEYKYEESPESLQNLMTFLVESGTVSQSRIDILVGLIFLLMLESGFVPSNYSSSDVSFEFNYKRMIALSKNLPLEKQIKNKNYHLKMCLLNLQQFEVNMAIVCISDDLVVNCFVKGVESAHYYVLLDPLYYFTSSNTDLRAIKFQQLDHLSREIKNKIAFPAKLSILKQNGIALPCIEDLPTEVAIIIMKKLQGKNLINFGEAVKRFCTLASKLDLERGKKMQ